MSNTSVSSHLRESFAKRQENKTTDIAVPGYDGLFVTYKALTEWHEVKELVQTSQAQNLSEVEQELQVAAQTLVKASVGAYAVIDGEKSEPLPPMGRELYVAIWGDDEEAMQPANDTQAVFLLFQNTVALMSVYGDLSQFFSGKAVETEKEILGKSEPAKTRKRG